MIHEPADINDPCCDECLAWYTGEDVTAAHTECVDCGKCREVGSLRIVTMTHSA